MVKSCCCLVFVLQNLALNVLLQIEKQQLQKSFAFFSFSQSYEYFLVEPLKQWLQRRQAGCLT
jgi:hypothetical protein